MQSNCGRYVLLVLAQLTTGDAIWRSSTEISVNMLEPTVNRTEARSVVPGTASCARTCAIDRHRQSPSGAMLVSVALYEGSYKPNCLSFLFLFLYTHKPGAGGRASKHRWRPWSKKCRYALDASDGTLRYLPPHRAFHTLLLYQGQTREHTFVRPWPQNSLLLNAPAFAHAPEAHWFLWFRFQSFLFLSNPACSNSSPLSPHAANKQSACKSTLKWEREKGNDIRES